MDKDEYWFLDAVWHDVMPLDFLIRKDVLESDLNRDGHGLSDSDVLEVLHHLFSRGDIIIGQTWDATNDFVPTREQIKAGFLEDQDISDWEVMKQRFSYKLTPQGGARWEAASRADWNRYFDYSSCYDHNANQFLHNRKEIKSTNTKLIITIVEWLSSELSILPQTMEWDVIDDWEVTYWKVLPHAHHLTFAYETDNHSYPRDLLVYKWYQRLF